MTVEVEVANRSGAEVDEAGAVRLARSILAAEGIDAGELGLAFVRPEEMRELKRDHLGIDEVTDVLSFPIDRRDVLEPGLPRQPAHAERVQLVARVRNQPRLGAIGRPGERHACSACSQGVGDRERGQHVPRRPAGRDQERWRFGLRHSPRC